MKTIEEVTKQEFEQLVEDNKNGPTTDTMILQGVLLKHNIEGFYIEGFYYITGTYDCEHNNIEQEKIEYILKSWYENEADDNMFVERLNLAL